MKIFLNKREGSKSKYISESLFRIRFRIWICRTFFWISEFLFHNIFSDFVSEFLFLKQYFLFHSKITLRIGFWFFNSFQEFYFQNTKICFEINFPKCIFYSNSQFQNKEQFLKLKTGCGACQFIGCTKN